MLFKVFLFVPSLVHFAGGSFTSEDPNKIDVSYELPSSRHRVTTLRNGRDRRMTHWESRSHSNFDDDDGNGDRGQISYASILEEPSSLRIPLNFEIPEKSTSPNFDVTRDITNDSKFDRCILDVIPARPIFSWLLFSGTQQNSKNSRNLSAHPGKYVIPRCRRTIEGWQIQEPIYVEEPGWILIELNHENSHGRTMEHREDPFYVARGKKSFTRMPDNRADKEKQKNLSNDMSGKFSRSTRKKRYIFGGNLQKFMLDGAIDGVVSSRLAEKIGEDRTVQPRNKHSDILDILNEPFFISRGKKNSMDIQRTEFNDGFTKSLTNFATRSRQILDTRRPKETTTNCDANSANCYRLGTIINKPASETFRDRRGVIDELFSESDDPFYVARGKRSSGTIREFNEISELLETAEIIDKNLSIGVQH